MAQKTLLDFVRSACNYDPTEELIPFVADGALLGWIKPSFAEKLKDWPEVFYVRPRGVTLSNDYPDAGRRSAVLSEVTETLATQGVIAGWRNELITVAESFYSEPVFFIERAASRSFGLMNHASHLNGITERNGTQHMWVARRSQTKAIDPGMLDNIVGGRIACGMSPLETLHKECMEEAGIGPDLAKAALAAGVVRICREVDEGVHREQIFVYDLRVSADFEPKNQDGEVSDFVCLPVSTIIERLDALDSSEFTAEAVVVMLDCLVRHGFLTSERSDYIEILKAIRP